MGARLVKRNPHVKAGKANKAKTGELRLARKIALYDIHEDMSKPPTWYLRKQTAEYLVRKGWAKWEVPDKAIQSCAMSNAHPLKCGQEKVYQSLGAECHPRIFCGGLTRTEHRPGILKKFHSARVSHG